MAKNSFKAKNSLNLEPQTRPALPDLGDVYFDASKNTFASKADYWSFLEAKQDIPFATDMTSIQLDASATECAIIKITGSPVASFNIHGLARNNNAKIIHLYNDTNQKALIKNQSVTEPVAANRINTPTGNDLSLPKKTLTILYFDDTVGCYIASPAGGGSGGTSFDQVQIAHGFTLFTPIYHDGTIWQKAQANAANTLATYVVTEFSTNAFTATKFGVIEAPAHGLTVGEFYFTSKDTAGAITSVEPIFGYSNPVIYIQDTVNVHIMCYRPSLVGDGNVSDSEIGAIMAFPSVAEPIGFLYADGRAVSRTLYNELFTIVGTRYGSGNGTTTFNLPDFRGQFLRGGVEVTDKTFLPAAVDIVNDIIAIPNHGFKHTGFKVRFSSTGTLPSPITALTVDYYAIVIDDNNIKLATSLANAKAGTAINLATARTLIHTILQWEDPDANSRFAAQTGGNSGNTFGANQEDSLQNITGTFYATSTSSAVSGAFSVGTVNSNNDVHTTLVNAQTRQVTFNASASARTSSETRPRNITVGWFIRYAAKGAVKGQDVPSGTILTYAGPTSTLPNGYLICDGSSVNRIDYPNLFAAIGTSWGSVSGTTFNLPDTRGLFLRGVDGLAGRDPNKLTRTAIAAGGNTGNNVGSIQVDVSSGGGSVQLYQTSGTSNDNTNRPSCTDSTTPAGVASIGSGGSETRPKNVYVNHIVRY